MALSKTYFFIFESIYSSEEGTTYSQILLAFNFRNLLDICYIVTISDWKELIFTKEYLINICLDSHFIENE